MRKISRNLEQKILRMLLGGASYRRASEKYDVGLATLNRIVQDARKKAPNFDDLRQSSIQLKKLDLTLFDVIRALPIFARLEELGVEVEELSYFLKGMTKLANKGGVEAKELTKAMRELVGLEGQTGKSYVELVDQLKDKQAQFNDIAQRIKSLQVQKQNLESVLVRERRELEQISITKKRLKKLDLDKLDSLAEFAEKKTTLEKKFQQLKMQVERKIRRLNVELQDKAEKHRLLRAEIENLWDRTLRLQSRVLKLSKLNGIIDKGMGFIPCKNCGLEGVFLRFPNRSDPILAQMTGFVWSSRCACCGQQVQYSYWDILTYVGWLALP